MTSFVSVARRVVSVYCSGGRLRGYNRIHRARGSNNKNNNHHHLVNRKSPLLLTLTHSRAFHTSHSFQKREDLYEVLQIDKTADQETIKKAYYRLAKKYHPDRPGNKGPDIQQKFSSISSAYEILSDEKKRAKYDKSGFSGLQTPEMDPDSLFDQVRQSMDPFTTESPTQDKPRQVEIQLTFDEAFQGGERTIETPLIVVCSSCHGTGGAPDSAATTCTDCAGRGTKTMKYVIMAVKSVCSSCSGKGTIQSKPCSTCKKTPGRIKTIRKFKVRIPPGVADYQVLRLRGAGDADKKTGKQGDLQIVVRVSPHPVFYRFDNDLHMEAFITVSQAILGDVIEIQTPDGATKITVEPGTQPNTEIVIPGKGFHKSQGRGDLRVHLKIVVPKNLTKLQQDLIAALSKDENLKALPPLSKSQILQNMRLFASLFKRKNA